MFASEKLRVDTCTLSEGWEDVRFILRINFRAPSNEETLSKWVCLITLYFVRLIKKKTLAFPALWWNGLACQLSPIPQWSSIRGTKRKVVDSNFIWSTWSSFLWVCLCNSMSDIFYHDDNDVLKISPLSTLSPALSLYDFNRGFLLC